MGLDDLAQRCLPVQASPHATMFAQGASTAQPGPRAGPSIGISFGEDHCLRQHNPALPTVTARSMGATICDTVHIADVTPIICWRLRLAYIIITAPKRDQ